MPAKGKRYTDTSKKVEKETAYEISSAIALVKETATAKFDETIEAHVRLGVDPRHADQQVRATVVLPHGTGKTKKILVFAKGEKEKEALDAGADYAGLDELVTKIQGGGIRKSFTVRRISYGVGVERTFPYNSPRIGRIEVVRHGVVRRAKLFYLRDLTGKAAKVRERIIDKR